MEEEWFAEAEGRRTGAGGIMKEGNARGEGDMEAKSKWRGGGG